MSAIEKRDANTLAVPSSQELAHTMDVVRSIATTEFVPKAIRGNNPAILACILYGREIGLGPMESLSEVHMIDGRPSLSAKVKVKRARQIGHDIWGDVTPEKAVVHGKRGDNGREMTVTFTLAEAKAAGLTSKANWKNWQEDMLWARAVSRLCRRLFTEDGMLSALDPDEAELTDDARLEEVLGDLPTVDVSDDDDTVDGEAHELAGEPDGDMADAPGAPEVAVGSEQAHAPEPSPADEDGLFTQAARAKGLVE